MPGLWDLLAMTVGSQCPVVRGGSGHGSRYFLSGCGRVGGSKKTGTAS